MSQFSRMKDEEKELLKSLFYNNDPHLLAVRNLFFGFELTPEERTFLEDSFTTPEVKKLIRKMFIPELDRDNPLSYSLDLWNTIQILDRPEHEIEASIPAREKMIEMLETALALFDDLDGPKVSLKIKGELVELIARNTFIKHIEDQLETIKYLTFEVETPEEKKLRLKKDSAK